MPHNFLVYKLKHLRKVNAQRRALSQPSVDFVPVLTKGQVLYVPAGKMTAAGGDCAPASCYNCASYNYGKSCMRIGQEIEVRKFTYPTRVTRDAEPIEYWPCCGMWDKGEPNREEETFVSANDPSDLGLIWINAPEVGQEYGGANCGGQNGGDDCDNYITEGSDKRKEPTAFCRVLQAEVENGAVCAAWADDDQMTWQQAQNILKELDGDE